MTILLILFFAVALYSFGCGSAFEAVCSAREELCELHNEKMTRDDYKWIVIGSFMSWAFLVMWKLDKINRNKAGKK
jgi:hypothetical protein